MYYSLLPKWKKYKREEGGKNAVLVVLMDGAPILMATMKLIFYVNRELISRSVEKR